MRIASSTAGLIAIIMASWIFFHWPLILADTLLLRDDMSLVGSVSTVTDPVDYVEKLFRGVFMDLQPIRDLTFFFNIKLYGALGYGAYHLTNLLCGGLLLLGARRLLQALDASSTSIYIGLLMIALHPLINTNLAWVSNRKHVLAVALILFYISNWLRSNQRTTFAGATFAILSFLAQPITLFIPFITVAYKGFTRRVRPQMGDLVLLVVAGMILALNYDFYATMPAFQGRNEVHAARTVTENLLNLTRVPIQVMLPVSLAVEYDPGNPLGLVGLVLWVAGAFLAYKLRPGLQITLFIILALSTLFPVLRWGVRDGYLLFTTVASIVVLATSVRQWTGLALLAALFFYSAMSYRFTRMWETDLLLHRTSYEVEGGVENLFRWALTTLVVDPKSAYPIFAKLVQEYPSFRHVTLGARLARAYYLSDHLSPQSKLREYSELKGSDIFIQFYHSKLLEDVGDIQARDEILLNLRQYLGKRPEARTVLMGTVCRWEAVSCKIWNL